MYRNVYKQFVKTSLSRLLIYRGNFLMHSVTSFVWMIFYLISIEVVFRYVDTISGWGRGETLLILATFFFIDGLRVVFVYDNLKSLPQSIAEGDLDFILTKPIDSQFFLSLRRINFTELNVLIVGVVLWTYALYVTQISLTWFSFIAYVALLICGLLITYALWLILVTCSFWYLRIENISEVFYRVLEMGRYPAVIFKGTLKIIVYTVVPLAVITNFPVEALLGSLTGIGVLYAVSLAVILLVASRLFWLYAIRHYSSASS